MPPDDRNGDAPPEPEPDSPRGPPEALRSSGRPPRAPGAGLTQALSRLVVPVVLGALLAIVLVLWGLIAARQQRVLAEREAAAKTERPPVTVVVHAIESHAFVDEVGLPGVVEAWEDVWVSAEVSGVVVAVGVEEGQTVTAGAPLCRIDDRDYVAGLDGANAARDAATSSLGLARLQFERIAKLRSDGTVGQAEYDAAEAAVRQAEASVRQTTATVDQAKLTLERTVVRAPISGVVSKRPATLGARLSPGARVARLVDTRKVRVNVGIPERDVLAVGGLDAVELTFAAVPGRAFEGGRIYLGVEPEDGSRTYRMQLAVDNPDGSLRPGMFAKARIVRGKPRQAVMVPLFAVIPRERDKVVFVEEGGIARRRVVETGALVGGRLAEARVEITNGLAPGDRLIIVGQRQLEDGDRVVVGEMPPGLGELMR